MSHAARSPVLTVLASKKRILDNVLREVRSHLWIHVAAGFVTMGIIIAGGGMFFGLLFNFLLRQEPFGPPLMERLVAIVLLAFFSMLVFSNLIITLTTTYISKETEFLVAFPMQFRSLFLVKLIESIFYSSWAFMLLSLPLFISYGMTKHAPLLFYPAAFLLTVPFLVIPASVGAAITMVISAYLPARKARFYSIGLLAAALAVATLIVKLMGLRSMLMSSSLQDFSQIMAFLNVGSAPLLPNYWVQRGMQAASLNRPAEAAYWFACLASTALMSVQVCLWLVPRLYYRGWALSKETASPVFATRRYSLITFADALFRPFSPPVRALLSKDMRTFWRDPAQWSQLIILFGLLVIYIANIRGLSTQLHGLELFVQQWPTILSFFNMTAACFVLSILTTRFIYPMLSLEGKQYWVIGLAPFPKNKLIWEKYGICVVGSALIATSLVTFSNYVLAVTPVLVWVSVITVLLLGFGLTSLAVGLGAMYPNFKEDNPARIANGLGGTMTIILSLCYIAANVALELRPVFRLVEGEKQAVAHDWGSGWWVRVLVDSWPYVVGFIVINLIVIVLPMRLGLRRWNRLEFHL